MQRRPGCYTIFWGMYRHALWSLLYSDGGWLIGRGDKYHVDLVLYLFILVVLGAPLAWHKVRGGIQSEWVGYALDVGRFAIGISESQIQWAVWCLEDKIDENRIQSANFAKVWGGCNSLRGPWSTCAPFWARFTPGPVPVGGMRDRVCPS